MLNCPTRRSSSSAVRASSWAEAAISCVDALVCCVEAETCCEDADDCSAPAATSVMSAWTCCELEAICWIAAAICSTRPFMSCTDAPRARNDSRACSTVATPSSVRRAASPSTPPRRAAALGAAGASPDDLDSLRGLGLDLADEPGDRAGRRLALLGQLADLLGDHGEAAALLDGARGLDGRVPRPA